MYCTRKISDDLIWVGANDRRLALFEGVYPVPRGISYNSYVLTDEKTVLFDTVDKAVGELFFENVKHALDGRELDYIVIHHMEPDHSATVAETISRYPNATVVCNAKILAMLNQFFEGDFSGRVQLVKEGDTLETGKHKFTFLMAPMVHWPEVMVSYDSTDKILFSADAFGSFGSLDGAIFSDEVNFERDCLDESRRYYSNIVGKYGMQVQTLLKKASALDIKMICPLHGFVHRNDIDFLLEKYSNWSKYESEKKGVVIAYSSVYGNTANACDILACKLREKGIETKVFDVSVTHVSEVISAIFEYSHIVFASNTYNNGIFIKMEDLLHDVVAHSVQNRTVAFVENGSWAPVSAKQMRAVLEPLKNMTYLENTLTIKSSLKDCQTEQIDALVDEIEKSM